MYHLVYKITNNINSMYYIGVHSTKNIDDGYMGSGTLIKKAIKETGVECFDREILHIFDTKKEAFDKELELVSMETLRDLNCYNLVIGGSNGVKTVSEKKALFSKKAPKIKSAPFARFNDNVYYEFSVIKDFTLKYEKPLCVLTEIMSPQTVMPFVTKNFNNLFLNKETVNFLKILQTKKGYKDNMTCKEIKWPDQQNTLKN
jgi:hypothetical protein